MMKRLLFALMLICAAPKAEAASMDFKSKVNVTADKLEFDQVKNILSASGNIKLKQNGNTLVAQKIIYDLNEKCIEIEGPLQLTAKEEGAVIEAQRGRMREDLMNGSLEEVKIIYQDNTQIVSKEARVKNGKVIIVENITYTPCLFCDGEKPLWEIDARKVSYDRARHLVQYNNAKMKIKGIPFLYTPYLAHPDPTIKRKTGLLPPKFGSSKELGFILGLPVFWAMTPQNDLLITPSITEEEGPVISGTYRHRFSFGKLDISATGTQNNEGDFRNYVKGDGYFDLSEKWRLSLSVDRSSDQTFLKTYGINRDPPAWLQSSMNVERIARKNYFKVETIAFQDLRDGHNNSITPYVLPRAYLWDKINMPFAGGSFILQSDFLNLKQREGDSVIRSANTLQYVQALKGKFGDFYTVKGELKADAYNIDDYEKASGDIYDGNEYRANPSLYATARIPFIRTGTIGTQAIEPIVTFHTAARSNKDNIPDNDSTDFELDDTNILSDTRFSGRDRIDTNTRVAYGLTWSLFTHRRGDLSAFIGQSYSIDNNGIYPKGAGLDDDFSHYVGRISADLNKNLLLSYRFRISNKDFKFHRNELDLSGQIGPARFRLDFIDIAASEGIEGRREIGAEVDVAVLRYISASAFTRNDLKDGGGTIKAGGSLAYEDECFRTALNLSKDYTKDRDYEGGMSLGLEIEFKTLGGFKSQRSLF